MTIYDCLEMTKTVMIRLEAEGKTTEAMGIMYVFDAMDKAIRESETKPIRERILVWRNKFGMTDEQIVDALRNELMDPPRS